MTTLKTLEMALEALEDASYCVQNDYLPDKMGHDWDEVIASLRQQIALEKKAENARELGLDYEPADEPVVCSYCHNSHTLGAVYFDQNCVECVKRMTRPQPAAQWISLTDDEIWDVYKKVDSMQYKEFSRAIEAKLKSKNEHQ